MFILLLEYAHQQEGVICTCARGYPCACRFCAWHRMACYALLECPLASRGGHVWKSGWWRSRGEMCFGAWNWVSGHFCHCTQNTFLKQFSMFCLSKTKCTVLQFFPFCDNLQCLMLPIGKLDNDGMFEITTNCTTYCTHVSCLFASQIYGLVISVSVWRIMSDLLRRRSCNRL